MARNDSRPEGARRPNDRDSRPGSRSKGHRGYRDEQPSKGRWSRDDRERRDQGGRTASGRPNWTPPEARDRDARRGPAFRTRGGADGGRDHQRDDRLHRGERPRGFDRARDEHNGRGRYGAAPARGDRRDDRPARDDRDRRFDRDDRSRGGDRRFDRDDRGPRRFDRDDRSQGGDRRFDRDDRSRGGDRRFDRDDRGPRRFDRDDRSQGGDRRFDRDDRSGGGDRRFDRDDRGPRRFDRDDRGPRRFDRDDRSQGGDRRLDRDDRSRGGDRRSDRDDRGPRRFDRDDRGPRRDDRGPRRSDREDRGDRRFDRDDRPRRDRSDERPRRDSTYYPSKESNPFEPKEDVVLERLEAQATRAEDIEGVTFADLGLGAGIAGALKSMGAERPFPIQAATIPDVIAGRDVLGRGRTGSGKSIAFGAPIVEMLLRGRPERRELGRAPRALVLAPTRELAQQLNHTIMGLGRAVGIFTTVIVGGVKQDRQVEALRRGVDIVIGTPGRIEDLVEQRRLNLGAVEIAVVDEADHMCELGFLEPVQRILRQTKPGSQKLLFSATLDSEVQTIVKEFLPEPAVHEVAGEEQSTSTIDHQVLVTDRYDKDAVLEQIVRNPGRIVVFTRTRAYAERLAEQFDDAGIAAVSLHGDLTQAKRNRSLEKLRRGKVDVLVATDVAARGIHIDDVALVVQADPPDEYKTYLHRAGRTGRAGNDGRVVTVIAPARRKRTQQLLDRAEIEAPMIPVRPGDDLLDTLSAPPAPAPAPPAEATEAEPAPAGADA
ncbi:DEAD/DEAH box helicase [Agrococcus carbonis]|uniref:Superfamily II DNA and RNA helicase n=1 Tax=Agrococcus carbonis TaxID=684552 RepID=A0A1H1N0K9_9MICO|nr:DEAD/DEAH box helicase [Agrococcus carbonis]SDR92681.1 Superfamily II DNA and RNA helicase [Agrococcus carbonis]